MNSKKTIYISFFIFVNLIIGFFIFNSTKAIKKTNNSLIIALMVKNEEKVIIDTLKPFVEAGIDAFFIYDTGSTDKTIEITKKYFKEKRLNNSYIIQEPFIDFGKSRNKALDLIEKQFFPNSNYILMLDAEWYIHGTKELVNYCNNIKNNNSNDCCYAIKMVAGDKEYYMSRLIKCNSNTRFYGRVHESLDKKYYDKLPENIYFTYEPKQESYENTKKRWIRDKQWLIEDHLEDPKNAHTIFCLAQTYADLEDFDNAIKYYNLYLELDKNSEYVFLVHYILGRIYDFKYNQNKNDDEWHNHSLNNYVKAYNFRPIRAEPLIRIASHYQMTENWDLCFMYSRRAVEIPYPKDEHLFIEKKLYNYDRYNTLSIAAWNVNQYDIGLQAIQEGLKYYPNDDVFKHNLQLFQKHKNNLNNK